MAPTFLLEDSDLIVNLHKLSKASPKLVKSSTYAAPSDPSITVRSWKMNEFKYYDVPSPFPTLARGIFTVELPEAGEKKAIQHRIVARGYDKFFNMGEVPWVTWHALEKHTEGPYTLSLKSNGCIIFIAALTPSKLLVTSKHSIGPVNDNPLSHAQAGEKWLRKYLVAKNRTEEDLASVLYANNWTAVSELCDDSFEEHVLGYPPEKTGLHLHGLNISTKAFKTLSHPEVDAFAEEWGFIKTLSTTLNTVPEVKEFTDRIGQTGSWQGEPVEGFVVRCQVSKTSKPDRESSPYAPGSSFFFKVKFDEPYMMYRDWREATKKLLSQGATMKETKLPKGKMKRPETKLYVRWVINEIKKDKAAFSEYNKGKGIIATRERFLAWMKSQQGEQELKEVQAETEEDSAIRGLDGKGKKFDKTVIVPVAIPGCGKTAVSVALTHLFGFGHTQSDDVHVKKAAPVFVKNVVTLLNHHNVVIADKNNHLTQHRLQLREATAKLPYNVRLLALNWGLEDKPPSTVHRICGDRIDRRGENHQTLRADKDNKVHEDVIWKFINDTQELADDEVDAVIDMELGETMEQSLRRAVEGCVKVLGLPKPSDEKIKEALDAITGYAVKNKKKDDAGSKKAKPRYFGLLPEIDVESVIGKRLEFGKDISEADKEFWENKIKPRVAKRPHVTITHERAQATESELWERCMGLQHSPSPPMFKFKIDHVVWNDRIMAATVDHFEIDSEGVGADGDAGQEGHEFVSKLPHDVRDRLHITIGTRDKDVAPFEAKAMVESWRAGTADGKVKAVTLEGMMATGRIKGLFS